MVIGGGAWRGVRRGNKNMKGTVDGRGRCGAIVRTFDVDLERLERDGKPGPFVEDFMKGGEGLCILEEMVRARVRFKWGRTLGCNVGVHGI